MVETKSRDAPPPPGERSAFNMKSDRKTDESIGGLVRELASEVAHLADKQAELVKAEISASVTDAREAAGAMAGAAILGLAGLGVTLMGIAYLLGEFMSLWLATLIVGIAALAGAYALYAGGREKLKSTSMTAGRTRHTLERAPEALSGNEKDTRRG